MFPEPNNNDQSTDRPKKKISLWPIRPSEAKINLPCFFPFCHSFGTHTPCTAQHKRHARKHFPPPPPTQHLLRKLFSLSLSSFFSRFLLPSPVLLLWAGAPIEGTGILSTLSVNEEEPLLLLLFVRQKTRLGLGPFREPFTSSEEGRDRQEGVCPPAKKGTVFPRVLFLSFLSSPPSRRLFGTRVTREGRRRRRRRRRTAGSSVTLPSKESEIERDSETGAREAEEEWHSPSSMVRYS